MALTKVQTIGIETGVSLAGVTTVVTLNASGNVTAVDGTFTGNVSVAGTLTYEDVTNVDSVGLITARNGVSVTGGDFKVGSATTISQDNIFTTGIVTATTYYGDGSNLTGISVDSTQIVTGDTSVQTVDTGSDGTIKFNTDGSERARIDSDGRLLVGTNTSQGKWNNSSGDDHLVQVESTNAFSQSWISHSTSSTAGVQLDIGRSRGTSNGSTTLVNDGDLLGHLAFQGADGSEFVRAAIIQAYVDGTPGANDMPGRLVFSTTADGAATPTERMRIDNTGAVIVGDGTTWSKYVSDAVFQITHNTNPKLVLNNPGNSTFSLGVDTGNDLVIRNESTSAEISRFDYDGRLLVGTSSAKTNFENSSTTPQFQIESTSLNGASLSILRDGNDAGGPKLFLAHGRTDAGLVNNGDELGSLFFSGGDGSEFVSSASITAIVDGTPGANDVPALLTFSTTADGASSPSERMRIRSNGNIEIAQNNGSYSNALTFGAGSFPAIWRQGGNGSGIHFTTNATIPANENGSVSDNTESLGIGSLRWTVLYATSSTINTSDVNEKQDIQSLSASELAVARELKNLIKKFRWRDAVAKKGDNARIHVGVIAQEVQQLFADHGLDATKYALWCSDTWYEVDGKAIASDGSHYTADSEGAVAKTRLGIRYEELLAFVLAAL